MAHSIEVHVEDGRHLVLDTTKEETVGAFLARHFPVSSTTESPSSCSGSATPAVVKPRLLLESSDVPDSLTMGYLLEKFSGCSDLRFLVVLNPPSEKKQGMTLYIKDLTGKSIALHDVDPRWTVLRLKSAILSSPSCFCGVEETSDFKLHFAGKQLQDENTLYDHCVSSDSTIHLVLRLRSPPTSLTQKLVSSASNVVDLVRQVSLTGMDPTPPYTSASGHITRRSLGCTPAFLPSSVPFSSL